MTAESDFQTKGSTVSAEGCDDACRQGTEHRSVAITSLAPGCTGVICETCTSPADSMLLRAMGLRPNAAIRICRLGEPTIVEVLPSRPGEGDRCARPDCRCRIGLAWTLAQRVMIVPDGVP